MPIYEYVCQSCKKPFEQLERKMSGEHKATCPACGSNKTARSLSVFAVAADTAKPSPSSVPGVCGHCGGEPGSCSM